MLRSLPLMRAAALTLFLVSASCFAAAPAPAASSAPTGQPLAANSPFLPAGVSDSGAAAGAQAGAIELRGEMSTPKGLAFCIYDTVNKKATWVLEGEQGYPFLVKSHDLSRDSVMVTYQGRTMGLQLPAAKVASSGMGAAPTLNMAGAPSADDAQKLAAIAAEVARRRQMREQELQRSGNPIPGMGSTPSQPGPGQIPSNGQPPVRRRQLQPPQ